MYIFFSSIGQSRDLKLHMCLQNLYAYQIVQQIPLLYLLNTMITEYRKKNRSKNKCKMYIDETWHPLPQIKNVEGAKVYLVFSKRWTVVTKNNRFRYSHGEI